jgi:hypothetical protein
LRSRASTTARKRTFAPSSRREQSALIERAKHMNAWLHAADHPLTLL